jgi:hypothetical protein
MPPAVYWTTRLVLIVLWLATAVAASRASARGAGIGRVVVVFAVGAASCRAWPWNYFVLDGGRSLLQLAGLHADRAWFKLGLGVALVLAAVVLAARFLRSPRRRGSAAIVCLVGAGVHAVLLCMETLSLDDALPTPMTRQPGRYLCEGVCALAALVGACLASRGPRAATA